MKSTADLQHRDWVLRTQQAIIAQVAPNVSTKIIDTDNEGKLLLINHVDEYDIVKLRFLTNTDQNNNYLYLEDFSVILEGGIQPLEFPGLKESIIKTFELSDGFAFLEGSKIHFPFTGNNFKGESINKFVDGLSALLKFVPDTLGIKKYYNLTLNPDQELPPLGDTNPNYNIPSYTNNPPPTTNF